MERGSGTVSALRALGYESSRCARRCACDELPCPLVTWLVSELRRSCPEVGVGVDSGAVLAGELKKLLEAMFYPSTTLTSETLTSVHLDRITDFLVSELQAARMLQYRESHPEDTEPQSESGKEQRGKECNIIDIEEETQAEGHKKDEKEVELRLASLSEGEEREPLLKSNLNSSQWSKVHLMNQALRKDYECRRQMMIKRFYVTLQSFAWGEREKERSTLLSSIPPFSAPLESSVSIALLLAAREDQSRILPVRAGPSTAIHKVLMGSVPDRGGRPGEIEPPMPVFTRRSEGGGEKHRKSKFQRQEYSGKKKKNKKRQL
ncbi:protein FAM98A isoform X2 [Pygocentrus nattereri]|uniref:protein FAM98A isoform X2 n=1 Tax=Pygocentrus nattereri TaxID=42514 RepID=UPI0008148429|nr:protein FAM98A isoform X2 [Pygocentrus nattereri]